MNRPRHELDGYPWNDAQPTCAHEYLLPELEEVLTHVAPDPTSTRILDLGCGNGAVTAWLASRGFQVVGVDPSSQGSEQARAAHLDLEFCRASAYDPLDDELGTFSIVVSLEVVERGWLKNVTIALLDRFDDHVDPLQVHGHIKFWSRRTLTRLLEEAGFDLSEFRFAGRIRPLAKSMIAVARRPAEEATSTLRRTRSSRT